MAPFSALPLARSRISLRRVRPRALLNITAICLLLAAATVWAQRPPPTAKTLLGRSAPSEILPFAPARKEYFLPGKKRPAPWEIGAFREIRPAAEKAAAAAAKPKPAAASEKAAVAADPHLVVLLEKVSGRSGYSVVQGRVKQFAHDFEVGARNHASYESKIPPELLKPWKEVTEGKRIFVIGAGKDSAEISEFAKSQKALGNAVFFYDFCRPLCSSEAVGAMFGTSDYTMLYNTPSAELSEYVQVEASTARFLKGLDSKQKVLISTEEILAGGSFRMHVANKPTPTPSAVK